VLAQALTQFAAQCALLDGFSPKQREFDPAHGQDNANAKVAQLAWFHSERNLIGG
jgi:hypothetical protein